MMAKEKLQKEILEPLKEMTEKEFVINKKSIPKVTLNDINPVISYKLNKRFMTAMGLCADVVEYLDHVSNFNDTKDTLLFLLISTFVLYTYKYAMIYIPMLLILKILHAFTSQKEYTERTLNFKRSYCIIQRSMKDTSEMVEFFDLFMKNYIYWGDKDKTELLLIELIKLSLFGIVMIYLPFNYLLIIILWVRTLEKSHFFF